MRTPKLAGLFLFVGALFVYLMLVKRHGALARPQAEVTRVTATTAATAARSQYCIMFDAGSMGTRVHIIQFRMDPRGSNTCIPVCVSTCVSITPQIAQKCKFAN